jgi:asparagine synthase (glutamine-hydrolysing)
MCGIIGAFCFNNNNFKITKPYIAQMRDTMSHRGPDGAGTYVSNDGRVGLGHRRLSIIDLSDAATQPMCNEDATLWVSFNGEIYNHAEIRQALNKLGGHRWKTDHSDTEVILHAFEQWGIDCVHQFRGMFAIALWDAKKRELWLIRDRIGVKPLYYSVHHGRIAFASEIKALLAEPQQERQVNDEAIYHYLTFLTVHAPNTFYKGIEKLEAGHYLRVTEQGVQKINYWDIAYYINNCSNESYDGAIQNTDTLLKNAIAYRNVADVPISIALSGGLDSALNLYHSSKINHNINAINIGYQAISQYDESAIAKRLSNDLSVHFYNQTIDDKLFKLTLAEYLNLQQDMPTADPNTLLMYLLSKTIRKFNAKVLLVGEGGDEIGGYPIYKTLQSEYNLLKWLPSFMVQSGQRYLPDKFAKRLDIFYKNRMISRRHIHGFSEWEKQKFWIGKQKYNSYQILHNYMAEIRTDLNDSFIRKISNIEYKLRLPELILPRVDYPSMAASVEARSPFEDHKLIEYSASLPFQLRMKQGAKSLLKESAKKYLPQYILKHPKVGFGMLLTPFLRNTLPQWFETELIKTDSQLHSYIDKKYLVSMLSKHNQRKNLGYQIWILYALHRWLQIVEL